jgi:hypothetical protein
MNRNLIPHAIIVSLITFGIFALINHNVAPVDWNNPTKFGWALLTLFMFYNTRVNYKE